MWLASCERELERARVSQERVKALGPLASSDSDRYSREWLKALGPLAVAERDIRALSTARTDSCPLRRLDERERASPFQSTRTAPHRLAQHRTGLTPPQPPVLLGLRPALLVPRTTPRAHERARQRAPRWL